MSRFHKSLCASLCALSLTLAYADAPSSLEEFSLEPVAELPPSLVEPAAPPVFHKAVAKPKLPEAPFTAFTGKVKGRKVRLRLQPDVDSRIITELNKNDLLSVVGEKGDFWAVEPAANTKAFIFRSFVLDDVVEGNRVNVRLEPSLDAPVIGHFNAGDKITHSVISAQNNKWLEIAPPSQARFYIAKDYIEYAGGPEVKVQFDKRRLAVEQLLDTHTLLGQAELRKSFEEVDFDRTCKGFQNIINDYNDFPEHIEQAKEALASFQENYLQKRISYLESRPTEYTAEKKVAVNKEFSEALGQITDKMRMWEPVEEALYLSWANETDNNDINAFYEEQKGSSMVISGILEAYNSPVKSKPGDFIVRDHDIPVGYVYSTQVNLQSLVGKQVALKVTDRPRNNFAFPAYYVLDVE